MSRLTEIGISVAMLLLAINVLGLNYLVLSHQGAPPQVFTVATETPESCDQACQDAIVVLLHPSPMATIVPSVAPEISHVSVTHEWYVPLGTATTHAQDYEALDGIEASIDTRNYPPIKQVIFETYMAIPTANGFAYAKLYNVTKGHDVWFSEVSMETDKVTGRDATITLDPGNNVYRVMMKSTMGYEVDLKNARIKIITE